MLLLGVIETDLEDFSIRESIATYAEHIKSRDLMFTSYWKELRFSKVSLFLWCLTQLSTHSRIGFVLFTQMMENENFFITMKTSDMNLLMKYLSTLKLSLKKEWFIKEKLMEKSNQHGLVLKSKRFSNRKLFIKEDTFSPNNEIILECFQILDKKIEYTLQRKAEEQSISKINIKEFYGLLYSYNKINPPNSETPQILINLVP